MWDTPTMRSTDARVACGQDRRCVAAWLSRSIQVRQLDRQRAGHHRQHGGAGRRRAIPGPAGPRPSWPGTTPGAATDTPAAARAIDRFLDVDALDEVQHGDREQEGEADQPGPSLTAADAPGQHDQPHPGQGGQGGGRLGDGHGKQRVQDVEPVADRLCQCRQQGQEPGPQDHQRGQAAHPAGRRISAAWTRGHPSPCGKVATTSGCGARADADSTTRSARTRSSRVAPGRSCRA